MYIYIYIAHGEVESRYGMLKGRDDLLYIYNSIRI